MGGGGRGASTLVGTGGATTQHCVTLYLPPLRPTPDPLPSPLGTVATFKNRFENPIRNGQMADSSHRDVRTMIRRSFILHQKLKGFVQRMGVSVLKKDLPPKVRRVLRL